MLFSFVLPAYKAKFLREAIKSILAQTYTNFELIIVNDASPEDLTSIVTSFKDERIQYYINKENIGGKDLVAQWNHCITYAKGDYLILASDDDVYHPDYLMTFIPLIEKYPAVNVFRPRVQYIDGEGHICVVEGLIPEWASQIEFIYSWTRGFIGRGIPFYVFNREALIQNGGFLNYPVAWYADDATVISMIHNGIVTADTFQFSFRYSGISISTKKNDLVMLKKKLKATIMFYDWLQETSRECIATNDVDEFRLKYIIENNRGNRAKEIELLLLVSKLKDCLKVYRKLVRDGYISYKRLLWIVYYHIRQKHS